MTLIELENYKNQKHYSALKTISRFLGENVFFYAGYYLVNEKTDINVRFPTTRF